MRVCQRGCCESILSLECIGMRVCTNLEHCGIDGDVYYRGCHESVLEGMS